MFENSNQIAGYVVPAMVGTPELPIYGKGTCLTFAIAGKPPVATTDFQTMQRNKELPHIYY